MTSLIEQEIEKLQEKGTWYKYYTKNKDLFLIIQKIKEELKKKTKTTANMPLNADVVKWEDIEKVL